MTTTAETKMTPLSTNVLSNNNASSTEQQQQQLHSTCAATAVDSAIVDAYATRVLQTCAPPEACIDDSLGPYVTSMLRCSNLSSSSNSNIESIPEYESLLELLQEHCSLSVTEASSALSTIAEAVRTGIVLEHEPVYNNTTPCSLLGASDNALIIDTTTTADLQDNQAEFLTPTSTSGGTPLKLDRLISVDLMDVLDDPSTPANKTKTTSGGFRDEPDNNNPTSPGQAFPPLGTTETKTTAPTTTTKRSSGKPATKSSSKKQQVASELAAALFCSSRPRQNSLVDNDNSKHELSPSCVVSQDELGSQDHLYENQEELSLAVEMLLSMNIDLSPEAAEAAAVMAGCDVNIAQYIIDGALSAPPICRHLLKDGCYRSDCQYSHDVDGHSCLFWLQGRCGKGAECKFRHGFSTKLLQGIHPDYQQHHQAGHGSSGHYSAPMRSEAYHPASSSSRSIPMPVATMNLVSHNMAQTSSSVYGSSASQTMAVSPFAAIDSRDAAVARSYGLSGSFTSSSWGMDSSRREQDTSSFANIASKGYSQSSSFAPPLHGGDNMGIGSPLQQQQTIRIPQDLWNPHINRDAAVFYIANPLERYNQVSKSITRDDVIDLHFQSTKTFPVVLSSILPTKLEETSSPGVWIVTGSGHHVGTKTHQKSGGALECSVMEWLGDHGYHYLQGRDCNGHGGALLVKKRQSSN